jgi:hypothetical protein
VSVDERSRLQLAEAAKRLLGTDEGITLMELLPPVGWADVATKHDLRQMDRRFDELDARLDVRFTSLEETMDAKLGTLALQLDARFEKGYRQIVVTMMSLFITGFLAVALTLTVR